MDFVEPNNTILSFFSELTTYHPHYLETWSVETETPVDARVQEVASPLQKRHIDEIERPQQLAKRVKPTTDHLPAHQDNPGHLKMTVKQVEDLRDKQANLVANQELGEKINIELSGGKTQQQIADELGMKPHQVAFIRRKYIAKNGEQVKVKRSNFSEKDDEFIRAKKAAGLNFKQIGRLMKRDPQTIRSRWDSSLRTVSELNYNKTGFTPEMDEKVKKMIEKGCSYEKIADELGMKSDQIRARWLKKISKIHPDVKYRSSKFTVEQDKMIIDLQAQGKTHQEIADQMKLKIDQVSRRWRKLRTTLDKIPTRPSKYTPEQDELMRVWRGKGKTFQEIADHLKLTKMQVTRRCEKVLSKTKK